jgi:5-formyltetrahydrofolate cyclo-ligase
MMNSSSIPARKALRAQCRTKLRDLSNERLESYSLSIASRLGALLKNVSQDSLAVAVYWPIHQEPRLHGLWQTLRLSGCRLGLPRIVSTDSPLEFVEWDEQASLIQNRWGITEVAKAVSAQPLSEWRVIVMPCVGFDPAGYRLGYGGGYYDRTLERWRSLRTDGLAIGVALEESLLESDLPRLPTDRRCDYIVTPSRTYFSGADSAVSSTRLD